MRKPRFKVPPSSIRYYPVYKMVNRDDKKVMQSHKLESSYQPSYS